MERQRRSFTEDYKRQAVELVMSSGRSVTSVTEGARSTGLGVSALVDKVRQKATSAAWRSTMRAPPMSAIPTCGDLPRYALLLLLETIRAALVGNDRMHMSSR